MELPDDIVIHKISTFLDLYDNIRMGITCRSNHKMLPLCLSILKKTTVERDTSISELVVRCPSLRSIRLNCTLEDCEYKELEKLQLIEFDNSDSHDSNVFDFNFPHLEVLNTRDEIKRPIASTFPMLLDISFKYSRGGLVNLVGCNLRSIKLALKPMLDDADVPLAKTLPITNIDAYYVTNDLIDVLQHIPIRELVVHGTCDLADLSELKLDTLVIDLGRDEFIYRSHIEAIEHMDLRKLNIFSRANHLSLANFHNLEELKLYRQTINFIDISRMRKLRVLALEECIYDSDDLVYLNRLPIQCLNLSKSPVRLEYINQPDLIELTLEGLEITDEELAYITCKLKRLTINNTSITGITIPRTVENLSFYDSKLSDEGYQHIGTLPLTELHCNKCNLNDKNAKYLRNLQLYSLKIINCPLTEKGLLAFKGMPLRHFDDGCNDTDGFSILKLLKAIS